MIITSTTMETIAFLDIGTPVCLCIFIGAFIYFMRQIVIEKRESRKKQGQLIAELRNCKFAINNLDNFIMRVSLIKEEELYLRRCDLAKRWPESSFYEKSGDISRR